VTNIYVSIGLDPLPGAVETNDLTVLRREVKDALERFGRGELPPLPES
jgi:hypothetical protein